jgi:outer membrane protein assembly factor BamB
LYASKRPRFRTAIFIFIIVSLILVACGTRGLNTNWPGLSTDGRRVYVAYGPGILAYDAATQEEVWSYSPESAGLSFYAAPSIQGDRVIFGDYGSSSSFSPKVVVTLYAQTVTTSTTDDELQVTTDDLWEKSELVSGSIVASPLQVGNTVYVGTGDNLVHAVDAEKGELLWPEPFETGHSIWGKPAFKDGVLFVNSLDKTVYAIDAEKGQELWHKDLDGALAGSPVVNLDLLYVASFDRQLHALDVEKGEEVWSFTAEDWIWSAPAYAQGVVYFADAKGNVFAVDGETGELQWDHAIGRPIQTSPVVVDDIVYVGSGSEPDSEVDDGVLTALNAEDGEEIWSASIPAPLYTTPVVVDDVVVVAIQSESALLMAFELNSGEKAWTYIPQPESGS